MTGTRNVEFETRSSSAEQRTASACSAFRAPRFTFGFTLMEMVVVLAIIGVTTAAVVPALTRIAPEDDVVRVARRLEQLLTATRTAALEGATTMNVVLIPPSARYWVQAGDGVVIDSGAIDLVPGVTLASTVPRPRIRFAPAGSASADSLLVLGPAAALFFSVDAWTGDVRVLSP